MPSYQDVYRNHPDIYDELVRAEDADGNLPRTLDSLCAFRGAHVAEAGAGTGRLTRLALGAGAAHIVATEIEPAMLAVARGALATDSERLSCVVADARQLPLASGWADVAMAGWVFGHFRSWMAESWEAEVASAVGHLERVTKAGGRILVIETLGTGTEAPAPSRALLDYYSWLEAHGFERTEIRTDYVFATVSDAERVAGTFFGDTFAANVREQQWRRVPECTGIWSKTV